MTDPTPQTLTLTRAEQIAWLRDSYALAERDAVADHGQAAYDDGGWAETARAVAALAGADIDPEIVSGWLRSLGLDPEPDVVWASPPAPPVFSMAGSGRVGSEPVPSALRQAAETLLADLATVMAERVAIRNGSYWHSVTPDISDGSRADCGLRLSPGHSGRNVTAGMSEHPACAAARVNGLPN
jgi:hypothetical protein